MIGLYVEDNSIRSNACDLRLYKIPLDSEAVRTVACEYM